VIAGDRLGHLDQVALATDRPAIDAHVLAGIELRVYPDRGLDLGAASFRGVPLAWIAPAGEGGADSADWRAAWGGGLLTTCGLDNVGAPSEGIGLHGTYTFLPAHEVTTERSRSQVVVRGAIEDPRGLRVQRTSIRVGEGRVEVSDRTTNLAEQALEAPLLYHVNLGWPLWDVGSRVETDAAEVSPRDEDAAPHDWSTAPDEPVQQPERVWEHVGATQATVVNERLGLRVAIESDLPRLWQWIDPRPASMRSRSSRRTARCSGARTTAPKARSNSSSRAESEARESRSPPRR
jgi:Domain of unknown function (DUF4432)